jgi:hypothetical protein
MLINVDKSAIYLLGVQEDLRLTFSILFNFPPHELGDGIKYLGFTLKPNNYGTTDWNSLLTQTERIINFWCKWIFQGSRLVLIKFVIEVVLFYWHLLTLILKGVLTCIQMFCFNYLWKCNTEYLGSHLLKW